ncbi:unnamed protein product [Cylicostephanus goldi]|uniref:Uncharacterized protein n=1 Tax=Cylicostephanus goldi TaxID=71465 RepID=A0A3P6QS35_CYLGO|nr:unnamed protein product [Cylicostephanus goldi]
MHCNRFYSSQCTSSIEKSTSTDQRSLLKAFDIDLSFQAGSSSLKPTSGEHFEGIYGKTADKPRTQACADVKINLPLIVKPLRQYAAEIPNTISTENSDSSNNKHPHHVAPLICRRRTLNGIDDNRGKWYSSSVDGGVLESSTLPRNFLRKPSILHVAAPVQAQVISNPHEEVPLLVPPPKPARLSHNNSSLAKKRDFLEKKFSSDLFSCVAKPVLVRDLENESLTNDFELPITSSDMRHFPEKEIIPSMLQISRKALPFNKMHSMGTNQGVTVRKARSGTESSYEVTHQREDSGYRSDRKLSSSYEGDFARTCESFPGTFPISSDGFCSESEPDSDIGEFEQFEDVRNRFAISRLCVIGRLANHYIES